MKKHYYKFESWLVPKVRSYTKRCTIRKARKRLPQEGDWAVLECWTGLPYRSSVERLGAFKLKEVLPIEITEWGGRGEGIQIKLNGCELLDSEARSLAKADGFDSLMHFAEFFRSRLPFSGHLYEWDTTQPMTTEQDKKVEGCGELCGCELPDLGPPPA